MCSRKDYVAVAKILSLNSNFMPRIESEERQGWDNAIYTISQQIANYFASDNPNFDRSRFLKACGIE